MKKRRCSAVLGGPRGAELIDLAFRDPNLNCDCPLPVKGTITLYSSVPSPSRFLQLSFAENRPKDDPSIQHYSTLSSSVQFDCCECCMALFCHTSSFRWLLVALSICRPRWCSSNPVYATPLPLEFLYKRLSISVIPLDCLPGLSVEFFRCRCVNFKDISLLPSYIFRSSSGHLKRRRDLAVLSMHDLFSLPFGSLIGFPIGNRPSWPDPWIVYIVHSCPLTSEVPASDYYQSLPNRWGVCHKTRTCTKLVDKWWQPSCHRDDWPPVWWHLWCSRCEKIKFYTDTARRDSVRVNT